MAVGLRNNRLLAIDDEPAFVRLVKTVAEGCGFDVRCTEDPDAFARMARLWNPTVIVLDLKIPGTDGIQLLRGLASDDCAAHIILSSGSDSRVLEAAMQLGEERGLRMSGLLPKPIRIQALQEMLAGLKRLPEAEMAADLAEALANDHLFLEYQPKLDCREGRFCGVEALVRWQHPVHGLIRPDEFIPFAEASDLINGVTDWVVAAAAKQAALWQRQQLQLDVAVNISARNIEDLDLPEKLQQHCIDHGVDPSSLVLELTETGAMREAVQMMDVLTRLRIKGFRLSIDDFGTGYSSLVQLQRLPFSEIKIDRSFVMRMIANQSCRVIAEIVVELGRRLGMKSVAEGVETAAALDALVATGCDLAQGYHLSRPIDALELFQLVRLSGTGTLKAPDVATA